MVTENATPPEDAREALSPDAPDRGALDDAYFQSLIDQAHDEDVSGEASVGEISTEETPDPIIETPIDSAPVPPPIAPPAPPPKAPPAPTQESIELQELRQRTQGYEQQIQRQAAEQQRMQLEQETQKVSQDLQMQGIDPQTATQFANQQRLLREREIQANQQLQAQSAFYQGKMNAAMHYSEQYGVPPQTLIQYNTPQEMDMAAKIQKLERVQQQSASREKKSAVPPQSMDSNQVTPAAGTTQERLVDSALNKAPGDRTEAESAALARYAGAI